MGRKFGVSPPGLCSLVNYYISCSTQPITSFSGSLLSFSIVHFYYDRKAGSPFVMMAVFPFEMKFLGLSSGPDG